MRILFALENYAPHVGGVETVFQEIAEGVVRRGHESIVVTSRVGDAPTHETLNGVRIYRVWTPPFARRYWYTLCALPQLIRQARISDVIHTTTYNAAPAAWLVGKITRKKVLLTVHEVWDKLWHQLGNMGMISVWAHRAFETTLLSLRFDWYATVSEFTHTALAAFPATHNKITTVYNGVDESLFSPQSAATRDEIRRLLHVDQTQPLFLFFGRPGVSKGVEYLMTAMQTVVESIPDAKLVMLLAKNPAERYEKMLALRNMLQLTKSVDIRQPVSRQELPKYIAAASAVVVPSVSEGFGFSAAETCSVGTPLVTTTAGSLPEVVSGITLIVRPYDSDALARAMIQSIQSPPAATPSKHFPWSATIDGYMNLYTQLISHA